MDHSSSFSDAPFANFPIELLFTILHLAAANDAHTCIALTLVCKQIRIWIDPLLYRTVTLWTPHTIELFRLVFAARPQSFFAQHVLHLFINGDNCQDIIRACTSIHRLAVYPPTLTELDLGPCPTPTEITLFGDMMENVPWESSIFAQVESLLIGLDPPTPEIACEISTLPSLRNCAVVFTDGDDESALMYALRTLLECPTLRVLLLYVSDREGNPDSARTACVWSKVAAIADKRLLVAPEVQIDGEEWVMAVTEGTGLWDGCEGTLKDWRIGIK